MKKYVKLLALPALLLALALPCQAASVALRDGDNAFVDVEIGNLIQGDFSGDGQVDNRDVEYLLWYTLFPREYPLNQLGDLDGNSRVDNLDVEYLLWHTLFPAEYPLGRIAEAN